METLFFSIVKTTEKKWKTMETLHNREKQWKTMDTLHFIGKNIDSHEDFPLNQSIEFGWAW